MVPEEEILKLFWTFNYLEQFTKNILQFSLFTHLSEREYSANWLPGWFPTVILNGFEPMASAIRYVIQMDFNNALQMHL